MIEFWLFDIVEEVDAEGMDWSADARDAVMMGDGPLSTGVSRETENCEDELTTLIDR